MAVPAIVHTATEGLLSVFTPSWAASLPDGKREVHPFEHWYALGGGVGILLHLGWCLHLIPQPERLAARLRVSVASDAGAWDRFDAAAAEVRGAALIMALGGVVEWVDVANDARPDLHARFGEAIVPFEIKQLNDGDDDARHARVDGSFWEGLQRAEAEATREVGSGAMATHAVIRAPLEALEQLARTEPVDVAAARALGSAMGRRLGEFMASRPTPGEYSLGADLRVKVFSPTERRAGHGHEASTLTPPPGVYVDRTLRSVRRAAVQLASQSACGVVVLERRWPSRWPPGVHEGVGAAVARGDVVGVAAVILREDAQVASSARTAETITVLPGPRWAELPQALRDAFPPVCAGCGRRHGDLDLLGWTPGSGPPWVHLPVVDESANDAIAVARSTPPEVRLRQALEQMRVACLVERANLRARHPGATVSELDAAFRAWQLRDV